MGFARIPVVQPEKRDFMDFYGTFSGVGFARVLLASRIPESSTTFFPEVQARKRSQQVKSTDEVIVR